MEIKAYTKKDLQILLENDFFSSLSVTPISKMRLLSQSSNPTANDDDVLLLVAYEEENNKVIGYFGLLPSYIRCKEKSEKIFWGTAWWADPNYKLPIGSYLLLGALEYCESNFIVSNFTESALRLYSNCEELSKAQYIEGKDFIFYYPKTSKMDIRNKVINKLLTIWNLKNKLAIESWYKKNPISNSVELEYVNYIDKPLADFIERKRKNELFPRITEELNHILQFPWVLSAPLSDKEKPNYYFSSKEESFHYLAFKIFINNKLVAFVILRIRDNFLSAPFIYYEDESLTTICNTIAHHIRKLKIYAFTSYNSKIVKAFTDINFPTLKTTNPKRGFLIGKKFGNININDYYLHDGDGDCVFT